MCTSLVECAQVTSAGSIGSLIEADLKVPPHGLLAPLKCACRHRHLIWKMIARDLEERVRGSVLGKVWLVLMPLFMLGMYTFVFSNVLDVRWPTVGGKQPPIALLFFVGLILFEFFFECLGRAASLMSENSYLIKKVVFPIEILAWVVVGGALVRLLIGSFLLAAVSIVLVGLPPVSILVAPIFVVLIALVAAGFVWFLAALGVYIRDARLVVVVIAPMVMFLSPIFYPLSRVPESVRALFYLNPLTYVIEAMRSAAFFAVWPAWSGILGYGLFAMSFAWAGYTTFTAIRPYFADVV